MKFLSWKLGNFAVLAIILMLSIEPALSNAATPYKTGVTENNARINWQWWENFNAPTLVSLLKLSVKNNFDIQIADMKVKEAENYIDSAKRELFPFFNSQTNVYTWKKNDIDYNIYRSLFYSPNRVSYELDYLGKNRTRVNYFLANRDYHEFEKTLVILSTLSEVASLYFNILKNEKITGFYKEITGLKREKLEIARQKYELELIPRFDLLQAEKELKKYEKESLLIKTMNKKLKNRLNFMVFGDKEKNTIEFGDIERIKLFYNQDTGISSNKISLRPDILMAEKQVKMAKLDAEKAKKALFPSLTLTGEVFQVSEMLDDFFSAENIAARLGGRFLYGIFEKGSNIARLRAEKNRYQQVLKEYEKTIVSSVNDVNNSLYSLKNSLENLKRTGEIAGFDRENLDIEQQKLEMELISYCDYIEIREKFILSRMAECESRLECLIHTISLYKALGGNA